jgi:hypothetical protein
MKKECEACGAMEPVLARGTITNRWLCEICHAGEYAEHEKRQLKENGYLDSNGRYCTHTYKELKTKP